MNFSLTNSCGSRFSFLLHNHKIYLHSNTMLTSTTPGMNTIVVMLIVKQLACHNFLSTRPFLLTGADECLTCQKCDLDQSTSIPVLYMRWIWKVVGDNGTTLSVETMRFAGFSPRCRSSTKY